MDVVVREGWEEEEEEGHGEGEGIGRVELGVGANRRLGLTAPRVWCAGSTGSGLPSVPGEFGLVCGVMLCRGWNL